MFLEPAKENMNCTRTKSKTQLTDSTGETAVPCHAPVLTGPNLFKCTQTDRFIHTHT